jgi:hypothetical protein
MVRIGSVEFGPIHGAADHDRKLVAVPEHARAGIGDARRRQDRAGRCRRNEGGLEIE